MLKDRFSWLREARHGDLEHAYGMLFERNPHLTWVYDLETLTFVAVNEAALRQHGYSREEFLSATIEDIRPPEDLPALREEFAADVTGSEAAGQWRHRKKDGSIIDVEIASCDIRFGDRRAKLVLATDVTEPVRAQSELQASEAVQRRLARRRARGGRRAPRGVRSAATDMRMPEMPGSGLARRLEGHHRNPLCMSGYTGAAALRRGVDEWQLLEKPFTEETLLRAVRAALHRAP